ncbi:MAG: quinone oxidoreductase [Rhodospirillaceae bacterium]|nr:quinone oxidoreductase [Rhodospirillaceae bacterium]
MRAYQIDTYGDESVVVLRDVPVPEIAADEVLVRLHYAGINFMDIHTRQGKYRQSETYKVAVPTTLGMEGAGVIETVGAAVDGLQPGQRVAYCLSWGSYAEFAAVPAWRIVPLPDAITMPVAAASLFQGLTAHYLIHDVGRLGPASTCLVHAASGATAQIMIQMATALGATVLATTSTPEKAAVARARGAARVFAYEEFADGARQATEGRGVDVVFDAIGAPTFRQSLRSLRKKGLLVAYGSVGGSVRDLDPIELGEAGSIYLVRPRLADHTEDAATIRRRAGDLFTLMEDGKLTIDVAEVFGFNDVLAAHRRLEHRAMVGKPVLKITG